MGSHKTANHYKAKDTVNRIKQHATYWEKIFTNPTSDRGLISKVYKELKKSDTKNSNNPIKNELPSKTEFSTEES